MHFINARHRLIAGLLLPMASMTSGCTGESEPRDNLPRVAVAGNVTFGGAPLPAGRIQFQPLGTESAVMTAGEIEDGRFSIARSSGPTPGKYRVLISSRAAPKVGPDGQPGGANREPEKIPKKYNAQSKLEIEIAPEGSANLDFPLDK